MVLKNRLKTYREKLNLKQQELGKLCGVSMQTIGMIERGEYSPSITLALTIAKNCGVSVEKIFYLQEKSENKKVKYEEKMGMCNLWIIGFLLGFITILCVETLESKNILEYIEPIIFMFGSSIALWILLAIAIFIPIICIPLYKSVQRLLNSWDGEDEGVLNTADIRLSMIQALPTIALIISIFLFGSIPSLEQIKIMGYGLLFIILFEVIIFYKKSMDLGLKKINPEKNLSVKDVTSQVKLFENLDEAEKMLLYKGVYKSYMTSNSVCLLSAVFFIICFEVLNIGLFALFIVCMIWLINYCICFKEMLKHQKSGKLN